MDEGKKGGTGGGWKDKWDGKDKKKSQAYLWRKGEKKEEEDIRGLEKEEKKRMMEEREGDMNREEGRVFSICRHSLCIFLSVYLYVSVYVALSACLSTYLLPISF